MKTNIYFLLCSERSGSNLITKYLNGHKDICGPSTKHLFNLILRNLFRYGNINNKSNWDRLVSDCVNIINNKFSIWNLKFSKKQVLQNINLGSIDELLIYFFLEEARLQNKKHLFIKENHLYEYYSQIINFYPEAKFFYLVRDPRDMALSWRKNSGHPGGIIQGARQWKHDQQRFLSLMNIIAPENIFHGKYEELIDKPYEMTNSFLNQFKIKNDPNIENFYKDKTTIKNSVLNESWKNISKEFIKNNSKKYINELSQEEILLIEKIVFNEMRYFSYNPVNNKKDILKVSENELNLFHKIELKKYPRKYTKNIKEYNLMKEKIYSL
jgi:hypothetical protein